MAVNTFDFLKYLLDDIFAGRSDISLTEYEHCVGRAYSDNEISGIQYDFLMGYYEG